MQYIMMVFESEAWGSVPKEEQTRIHRACAVWHADLMKSGQSRGAAGLQPPSTSTTIRERKGKVIISDGPFMETKEVLGGFERLECKNLDEAIAIAKSFPALSLGFAVEIRPLLTGEQLQGFMED